MSMVKKDRESAREINCTANRGLLSNHSVNSMHCFLANDKTNRSKIEIMISHNRIPFRLRHWFERFYKIGVGIKGIDGLIELAAGIALLVSPQLVHVFLQSFASELGEHSSHKFGFIIEYIARIDSDLARSGTTFLIIFLVIHGLVKLGLVYCLLRKIIRAYPVALAILVIFLAYQSYVLIVNPSIAMAIFTILDVAIVWLVWGEYRDLKAKK